MVRLMDSIDLYQKSDGQYNSDVITKLTYNYRSHPQILKVPNYLFYDGELVVRLGLAYYDYYFVNSSFLLALW